MSLHISKKQLIIISLILISSLFLYYGIRQTNRITEYTFSTELENSIPECKKFNELYKYATSTDPGNLAAEFEFRPDGTLHPIGNDANQVITTGEECMKAKFVYIQENGADVDGITINYRYD